MSDNRKGCPYGLCVIIGLRFFVLQKIVRVRIPLTICKKIKGYSKCYTLYFLAESKGFFRRTAVCLRIASLFNHGLSNSPPDCFHRRSRPSLFESLAVLSTKNKGYSKRYTLYSLAESKGFFRRTAVCLRIASLFNYGLSNSPPDCFHQQSRPYLFESLAVLSTKKQRVQQMLYPLFSGGEQGIRTLETVLAVYTISNRAPSTSSDNSPCHL